MTRASITIRSVFCALLLQALCAAAFAQEQKPDCRVKIISSLAMEPTDEGRLTVPVMLEGKPFHMLLDTGDYYSLITMRTAQQLGKEVYPTDSMVLVGWGGETMSLFTTVNEFGFGGMKRGKTQFMVTKRSVPEFDGLLGADFLYYLDLDLDFAKAKFNLVSPDRCKGKAVYWTRGDYGVIPFDYKDRWIQLPVELDGKKVKAIIDTGASNTVMSLDKAAAMFDWDDKTAAAAESHHAFKTLSIGGVTVTNPVIDLVPDRRSKLMGDGMPRIILGMNIVRRLHLFISYKEEVIYVTPAEQY